MHFNDEETEALERLRKWFIYHFGQPGLWLLYRKVEIVQTEEGVSIYMIARDRDGLVPPLRSLHGAIENQVLADLIFEKRQEMYRPVAEDPRLASDLHLPEVDLPGGKQPTVTLPAIPLPVRALADGLLDVIERSHNEGDHIRVVQAGHHLTVLRAGLHDHFTAYAIREDRIREGQTRQEIIVKAEGHLQRVVGAARAFLDTAVNDE